MPSYQGCRWPTLITLIKSEMCVFFMCVWMGSVELDYTQMDSHSTLMRH